MSSGSAPLLELPRSNLTRSIGEKHEGLLRRGLTCPSLQQQLGLLLWHPHMQSLLCQVIAILFSPSLFPTSCPREHLALLAPVFILLYPASYPKLWAFFWSMILPSQTAHHRLSLNKHFVKYIFVHVIT